MLMLRQPRTHTQKYPKRPRIHAISRIQRRGLGVKRDIRSQAELPTVALDQIAHSAEGVRADAISRMYRRLWKQFVFVHQLQAGIRIVVALEVYGRIQQVAVQIGPSLVLVLASPDERCRPISFRKRPAVLDRSALPLLVSRFRRFRMRQASIAVLRRPVA